MTGPSGVYKIDTVVHNFGEPTRLSTEAGRLTAETKSFGHDGPISLDCLPADAFSPTILPTFEVDPEEVYCFIEVPDHIDNRSAYGRRKTQDFSFPGAHIRSHATVPMYKAPLEHPERWIKRVCGHFSAISAISAISPREEATKKSCAQCIKQSTPPKPQPPEPRRSRKRTATGSSTWSASNIKNSDRKSRKRQQCQSDCIALDNCGVTLAENLGYIIDSIDSILEEHQNTLQQVISNIQFSKPTICELRRKVSEDLGRRSKIKGDCSTSCRLVYHHTVCSHVYQQCQSNLQACEWQPACYVPPKVAEKLNVGSSGQNKPSVNDSLASLQNNVNTASDVADLINSAADNFGLDLDQKPTAEDNLRFEQAPVEPTPPNSRHHSLVQEAAD